MEKSKKSRFIEKAQQIHGDTYDYSLVEYVNLHLPVDIICNKHGTFLQTPSNHIYRKTKCPKCSDEQRPQRKKLGNEKFISKSQQIHGDVYDYSSVKYVTAKDKVEIICKTHGSFYMTPNNHLYANQGCPKCGDIQSGVKKQKVQTSLDPCINFINRAISIHGPIYDYSKVQYINSSTNVEIVCEEHGSFFQTPNQHVNPGTGCPHCSYDNYVGGYSNEYFESNPETKSLNGILYLVRMKDENSDFLKIGITRSSTKFRFRGYKQQVEEICVKKTNIYDAFLQEQEIQQRYKQYRYFPVDKFKGWTECFKYDPDLEQVLKNYFT